MGQINKVDVRAVDWKCSQLKRSLSLNSQEKKKQHDLVMAIIEFSKKYS